MPVIPMCPFCILVSSNVQELWLLLCACTEASYMYKAATPRHTECSWRPGPTKGLLLELHWLYSRASLV